MPSGGTPNDFFATPADFGGINMGITVDPEISEALRSQLKISRDEAYKFVSDDFRQTVETAYAEIGSPALTVETGWQIFNQLKIQLRNVYTTGY